MHLGILLCGHTMPQIIARHGEYDAMFARFFAGRGWRLTTWRAVDGELPDDPHAADAWLLTGSPNGAYDPLPFIPPLENFIRQADAARVPMVGICFGHQIIAQALGGRVEKFSGGWGLGPTRYPLEGLGEVCLTAWHQDQVTVPPPGARTLSATPFCAHAALAIGDHILTLQPHPEFTPEITADFARFKRGDPAFAPEALDDVEARLARPLDGPRLADWLAGFLDRQAEPRAAAGGARV